MIRKIVFATDLGAFTSHALLHVEILARQFDARIAIVHAVAPLGEFATAVVKSHCPDTSSGELFQQTRVRELLETIREEIFERLMGQELAEINVINLVSDIVVLPGNPAAVVLQAAEDVNADLIVVGSHSPQALDGRLLGSVAAKVLQLAKVPVLMVPMLKDPFGHGLARMGADRTGGCQDTQVG